MKDLLKELEEGDQSQVVKLGDASIASPFTSRFASILCSKLFIFLCIIHDLLGLVGGFLKILLENCYHVVSISLTNSGEDFRKTLFCTNCVEAENRE